VPLCGWFKKCIRGRSMLCLTETREHYSFNDTPPVLLKTEEVDVYFGVEEICEQYKKMMLSRVIRGKNNEYYVVSDINITEAQI
jgi:hypothetical protein